uniref:Anoctamin n=2 Tax=Lygus hesperus TaxID=30085 RepID=A0A0A9Y2I0_LYGHE
MHGGCIHCHAHVFLDRRLLEENSGNSNMDRLRPSVVYAILIYIMNLAYRKFATFLTEWENHRTQSQFDRHRVTKLVLFEFVNNFMSLFYVAFIIRDIELLRYQLAVLLIVLQAINNCQEALFPLIILRYFKQGSKVDSTASKKTKSAKIQLVGVKEIDEDDSRLDQAVAEGRMDIYDDPYDDYLELFVQFGYVFLFSAVYPMAAFWAFANNCLEIRSDAFKICRIYQRPMARKVKDIGAWQRSFQAICALSVMTNCALLSTSPSLKAHAPDMSSTTWYLLFVLLEHLLLGARQILHYAIPDKPEWVRIALAKGNYKAKQALKQQRLLDKLITLSHVSRKSKSTDRPTLVGNKRINEGIPSKEQQQHGNNFTDHTIESIEESTEKS